MTLHIDYSKAPTDNLYKLMAIGGVVLIVASFYFDLQHDYELNQIRTQTKVEFAALQREWEFVKIYLDDPGREKKPVDWGVVDKLTDFYRRSEEYNARMAQLSNQNSQREIFINRGIWAMLLSGVGLTISGFSLWYLRLQRHQDRLLLLEVQKAEKAAKSATAS
jgi:hypothetical protein